MGNSSFCLFLDALQMHRRRRRRLIHVPCIRHARAEVVSGRGGVGGGGGGKRSIGEVALTGRDDGLRHVTGAKICKVHVFAYAIKNS